MRDCPLSKTVKILDQRSCNPLLTKILPLTENGLAAISEETGPGGADERVAAECEEGNSSNGEGE